MKYFFLSMLIFAGEFLYCQDSTRRDYRFEYGTAPNMESASQSALGMSSLAFDWLSESIGKNVKPGTLNTAMRILNVGMVQIWLGLPLYATIPHEFFGHHNRAAEFGIKSTVYLNFPSLGGKTVFYAPQSTPVLDRQMIVAAGPEVTQTIAYKATQQLYSGDWSPSYIGDYLMAGKFVDAYYYYLNNVRSFLSDPNKYVKDNAVF